MRTLARWCFSHRRIVVLGWIVALVGVTAIHSAAGSALQRQLQASAHAELRRGAAAAAQRAEGLGRHRPGRDRRTSTGKVTDPAVRAAAEALLAQVATLAARRRDRVAVRRRRRKSQISPSGQIAFANVTFDDRSQQDLQQPRPRRSCDKVTSALGQRARSSRSSGQVAAGRPARTTTSSGLLFGFLAAAVVLFIVFGSLLATLLPLLTAGALARHRHRRRRPALARDHHGLVLERAGAADRPRRRRRLRAVHRHPLQAGGPARAERASRRWSSRSTPPDARSCSPG